MKRTIGLLVMAAAVSAGCGGAPRPAPNLQPLQFMVKQKPKVVSKTQTGATLRIVFEVTNPGVHNVILRRLNIDATINGAPVGNTTAAPRTEIAPGTRALVSVDFSVSYLSGGLGIINALSSDNVTCTVEGTSVVACADSAYDPAPTEFPIALR